MKCFNHNELDAVGVCKNCHRGLCRECLVDLKDGLACKDCVDKVNMINQSLERQKQVLNNTGKLYTATGIIALIVGIFCFTIAFMLGKCPSSVIFNVLGIIFLLLSFVGLTAGRRILKN